MSGKNTKKTLEPKLRRLIGCQMAVFSLRPADVIDCREKRLILRTQKDKCK